MEEYLIFAAIGGLIFTTLLVNSVAEAYEQKQREKRLKILAIKRGLDNISDLLERLQKCNIGDDIRDLLLNEIMARIEAIERIDRKFGGVQALIEEAGDVQQKKPPANPDAFNIKDEREFKLKLLLLGQLIRLLNTGLWYSRVKPQQRTEFINSIKVLRCEKIFQFYSDKAQNEAKQRKYLLAQENYQYILQALKSSGVADQPRIVELVEQASFMLKEIASDMSAHMQNLSAKNTQEAQQQEEQQDNTEDNKSEADTINAQGG